MPTPSGGKPRVIGDMTIRFLRVTLRRLRGWKRGAVDKLTRGISSRIERRSAAPSGLYTGKKQARVLVNDLFDIVFRLALYLSCHRVVQTRQNGCRALAQRCKTDGRRRAGIGIRIAAMESSALLGLAELVDDMRDGSKSEDEQKQGHQGHCCFHVVYLL